MTNFYQCFTYKMAAKINLPRCGTKLRDCHNMRINKLRGF